MARSTQFSKYAPRVKPLTAYHNQKIQPQRRLDFPLYCSLLSYRSHSGSKAQKKYVQFLRRWIESNISDVICWEDKAGNLYARKGAAAVFPAFVSHCDINQSTCNNARPIRSDGWIIGIDTKSGERCGLGHDDKAGNLLALMALKTLPAVKCLFTTDEEIGGLGAGRADLAFFQDCAFALQADRNAYAGPELITYSGGLDIAGADFVSAARPLMDQYNFEESRGIYTDVNVLKSGGLDISAVNLTAGYFDEHSDSESLYIPAFENTAAFALDLCAAIGGRRWDYSSKGKGGGWNGSGWADPDGWADYSYLDKPAAQRAGALDFLCDNCGGLIDAPKIIDGWARCPHCYEWQDITSA